MRDPLYKDLICFFFIRQIRSSFCRIENWDSATRHFSLALTGLSWAYCDVLGDFHAWYSLTHRIFKLAFSINRILPVRTMAAAKKDLPQLPPDIWTIIIDNVDPPDDFLRFLYMYQNLRAVCRDFKAAVDHIFITQLLPQFETELSIREFFSYCLLPRLKH